MNSENREGNPKIAEILQKMGKLYTIIVSFGIIAAIIVGAVYLVGTPAWVLIYSWEKFTGLFSHYWWILYLVGVVGLIVFTVYGLINSVQMIKAFIRKRDYGLPKGARAAMTFNTIFLVGIVAFAPDIYSYFGQYKKFNRDQITVIVNGNPRAALMWSDAFLKDDPDDLEAHFLKVLSYTRMNKMDRAISALSTAEDKGLPIERIIAGPRNLFSGLYSSEAFQNYVSSKTINLIHGPMLGSLSDTNASIWLRTADESNVQVRYSKNKDMSSPSLSSTITSSETDDYTAIVTISELDPDTKYFYEIIIDSTSVDLSPTPWFKTYPVKGSAIDVAIGFGGGAGYTPEHEYMWNTIDDYNLSAFLAMGDNVYIDTPEVPETQQYCYYRRQSRSEFRNFTSTTPIYAIWDDHDFGDNDCTSTQDVNVPDWKLDVLDVFKENFVNPSYGGETTHPGIWTNFSMGDVDFFMLDCRFYRQDPSKVNDPSMLGPEQKEWLLESINKSDATFKFIASSVPWAEGTKPGSKDTWDGFPGEREEIFSFIEDEGIEGVVLLSADRHRSDAWLIERPAGYDLYDFMSSRLTNVHTHGILPDSIIGYNEECSFGHIAINTTKMDPELTYTIINIDGIEIDSLTLKRSQLEF